MKLDELFGVRGQVALVTGGASGLGLAMAAALATNGAKVVIADVDGERLRQAAVVLDGLGDVETAVVDIADPASVDRLVDGIDQRHGRLDVAVLNAGISIGPGFDAPAGEIDNVTTQAWERVLDVNLSGTFHCLQAVARLMKRQRRGRIVTIASMAGLRSQRSIGYGYIASKSGVVALTKQCALELAQHGVQVNCIAPGPFATQIAGGRINTPEGVQRFSAMTPMNRVAAPQEICGALMLLASGAGSFMTGAIIAVDGGMSAH